MSRLKKILSKSPDLGRKRKIDGALWLKFLGSSNPTRNGKNVRESGNEKKCESPLFDTIRYFLKRLIQKKKKEIV